MGWNSWKLKYDSTTKNLGNFGQFGPRPSQFHHGGPQGTTYHVIVGPNCGPNSKRPKVHRTQCHVQIVVPIP
jgi:hypothetical protein